jgi:hypothetical protein
MSNNNQFLFIELNQNALQDGRAFDGVAFGTFRDMLGREITLDADDAEPIVASLLVCQSMPKAMIKVTVLAGL